MPLHGKRLLTIRVLDGVVVISAGTRIERADTPALWHSASISLPRDRVIALRNALTNLP